MRERVMEETGGMVECQLCGYATAAAHFELHVDHMLLSHKAQDHNEATQMAIRHFKMAQE